VRVCDPRVSVHSPVASGRTLPPAHARLSLARAFRWLRAGDLGKRIVRKLTRKEIDVPLGSVQEVVARHGAQTWFIYAFRSWRQRPEPRETCKWLQARLSQEAKILEAGCGMATNLIWFAQRGFR